MGRRRTRGLVFCWKFDGRVRLRARRPRHFVLEGLAATDYLAWSFL
jgi:hypothetical protein